MLPIRASRFLAIGLTIFLSVAAHAATLESSISDRALDLSHAVTVQGIQLALPEGTLILGSGTIVPVTKINDQVDELAFIGSGMLQYETTNTIESSQIELFTGAPSLSVRFDAAILVVPSQQVVGAILNGKPAATLDAAATQKVNDFYASWKTSPEQKIMHVDGALYAAASGDPFYRAFIAGLFRSPDLGNVTYMFNPVEAEQLTIGQFVAADLDAKAEKAARKELARQHKQGKHLSTDVEDLGDFDVWTSSTHRNATGEEIPGFAALEPSNYEIDLNIGSGDLATRGKTRITASMNAPQHTIAELEMNPDVHVTAIRDGAGKALAYLQSRGTVFTALPKADANGGVILEIEHEGKLVEKGAWKMNALRDTLSWYPHTGDIDRATYDVTFHHPAGLTVLSPGEDVAVTPGLTHRRATVPIAGFTFEISKYKTEEFDAGGMHVVLAYDPNGRALDREVKKEVRETIEAALPYFVEKFGALPVKKLTIVTVPRDFSQSVLGFITLSTLMMEDFKEFAPILGITDRRTVIAHEISHQWWGNSIGWEGYRDQWLSEAMANYAADAFGREKLDWSDRVRIDATANWQDSLLDTSENGRLIESLGPIVLGSRLSSSKAESAYVPIIYKKGGLVLTMLARELGEENFAKILGVIAKAAANKVISTGEFITLVSRAAGGINLKPFADRYIYGTGVPDVRYTYTTEKQGDGWKIRGTATQQSPLHYRYRVVKRDAGGHDVVRTATPAMDIAKLAVTVPAQIGVMREGDKRDLSYRQKQIEKEIGNATYTRSFKMTGAESSFDLDVPLEPRAFWLDRNKQVLARFIDANKSAKRALLFDGRRLEAEGKFAEAEQRYRDVAAAKNTDQSETDVVMSATEKQDAIRATGEYLDALAYLAIARMYLDQNRDAEVPAIIQSARKAVNIVRRDALDESATLLESRLQLRRGDYDSVVKKLRKMMLGKSSTSDAADGYAMLAVAANEMKEKDVAEDAADKARRKGVDLGPIASLAAPK